MYNLCVIDMQEGFSASNEIDTIQAVCRQISIAKRKKANIFLVEYSPHKFGKTHTQIMQEIGDYQYHYIEKRTDDGSKKLYAVENTVHLPYKLVGVNTWACVLRTANGLRRLGVSSDIRILLDACNHPQYWDTDKWYIKAIRKEKRAAIERGIRFVRRRLVTAGVLDKTV